MSFAGYTATADENNLINGDYLNYFNELIKTRTDYEFIINGFVSHFLGVVPDGIKGYVRLFAANLKDAKYKKATAILGAYCISSFFKDRNTYENCYKMGDLPKAFSVAYNNFLLNTIDIIRKTIKGLILYYMAVSFGVISTISRNAKQHIHDVYEVVMSKIITAHQWPQPGPLGPPPKLPQQLPPQQPIQPPPGEEESYGWYYKYPTERKTAYPDDTLVRNVNDRYRSLIIGTYGSMRLFLNYDGKENLPSKSNDAIKNMTLADIKRLFSENRKKYYKAIAKFINELKNEPHIIQDELGREITVYIPYRRFMDELTEGGHPMNQYTDHDFALGNPLIAQKDEYIGYILDKMRGTRSYMHEFAEELYNRRAVLSRILGFGLTDNKKDDLFRLCVAYIMVHHILKGVLNGAKRIVPNKIVRDLALHGTIPRSITVWLKNPIGPDILPFDYGSKGFVVYCESTKKGAALKYTVNKNTRDGLNFSDLWEHMINGLANGNININNMQEYRSEFFSIAREIKKSYSVKKESKTASFLGATLVGKIPQFRL